MKQDLKIILSIIGIVVALVIIFQVKACITQRNDAKISRLEGELKAAEEQAEKIKSDNQVAINEMGEEIQRQGAEITAKNETILVLQKQDEEIVPTEVIDTPGEGQDWEEIAGINAEAAKDWKTKYYKAQDIIKELGIPILIGTNEAGEEVYSYPYDSVTYKLDQKYLLSEERAKLYKQNWALAENLNKIKSSVIEEKDKQIARLKLGKTVERIITVPLAIYGGFKIGQAIFGVK